MPRLQHPHIYAKGDDGQYAVVRKHPARVHVSAEITIDEKGNVRPVGDIRSVIEQDGAWFAGSLSAPKTAEVLDAPPEDLVHGAHPAKGGGVPVAAWSAAHPMPLPRVQAGPDVLIPCKLCDERVLHSAYADHLMARHIESRPAESFQATPAGEPDDADADGPDVTPAPRRVGHPTSAERRARAAAEPRP